MDRNKIARTVAKQRNVEFEKTTPEEEASIKIEQEVLGTDTERYRVIRHYLISLLSYNRKKSELNDIHYTIETLEKNNETHWKAPDQYISLATMKERLHENYVGMRKTEVDLQILKRQVFEAYKVTPEEVDEVYNRLIGKKTD